ncbi:diguanylate cyclase domain-containing protein [Microcoleus sp.]|uniref:diguanylate cyclase domain-containing protein n=1 Tax=Microcoleus sp. TaxID=44472 RepID=UPI00403EC7CC
MEISTKQTFSWSLEKVIEKVSEIALQLNEFGELETILQFAVEETRVLLQADRVIIYRFLLHRDGVVFAESVDAQWRQILGKQIYGFCFEATWVERYSQGQTSSISDIHSGHLQACDVELLDRIQVQAIVVVPILLDGKQQQSPKLWGLLIAHQCQSPRQWEPLDVQILQHVAVQLGLRMRHLESHHPVLPFNQSPKLETEPNQTAIKKESAPRVNHQNCLQPEFACSLSGGIATGQIMLCDDSETDARVDRAACQRIGLRSMVVVPLFYQDDRVGVLKVVSATPSSFTESDIQTLQLMAGFLASSLHLASEFDAKNILLSQLLESEARYRSVIASMAEGVVLQLADGQITACNASAERILGLTAEQMMGRTSVDLDWRTVGEDGEPFPDQQHPATIALKTGKPLSNVVMGVHKPDKTLTWISMNSQPLFHLNQSQPYAVVTIFADITERKQALEMLRHRAEQERLIATTDGLTQVANRRCFDERLQSEWHRLMQGQQQLSLIMLDVDYFKRYNDFYGHQAGDTCLVKVAKAAAAGVKRSTDLFVRYGGEEFAAILPNTDAAGAIAVAESIREAIRDLAIPHEQSDVSSIVTVSMGIASIVPCCEKSPNELIVASDRALYDAKRQGRDRYRCAHPMTAPDLNTVVE